MNSRCIRTMIKMKLKLEPIRKLKMFASQGILRCSVKSLPEDFVRLRNGGPAHQWWKTFGMTESSYQDRRLRIEDPRGGRWAGVRTIVAYETAAMDISQTDSQYLAPYCQRMGFEPWVADYIKESVGDRLSTERASTWLDLYLKSCDLTTDYSYDDDLPKRYLRLNDPDKAYKYPVRGCRFPSSDIPFISERDFLSNSGSNLRFHHDLNNSRYAI